MKGYTCTPHSYAAAGESSSAYTSLRFTWSGEVPRLLRQKAVAYRDDIDQRWGDGDVFDST